MNTLKGIGAILAGIIFIVASHAGTDFVLEKLGIFTPPEQGFSHYVDGRDRHYLPQHLYGNRRLHYRGFSSRPANAIRNDSRINRACSKHARGNSNNTDETRTRLVSDRAGVLALPCVWLGGRLKTKDKDKHF